MARGTWREHVEPAGRMIDPAAVHWSPDGLVPAVVRDAGDGAVLMLAYMDAEALSATIETGLVHFHSRSRGRLWQKGETSGNVLRLRELALDCDADAILVSAEAAGPACHTGSRSCFGDTLPSRPESTAPALVTSPAASEQGFEWLERLWATIADRRAAADPERSHTARLIAGGVDACARKVTEEATEVLLAARDDAESQRAALTADRATTRAALASEVADLLYHLLVLSAERDLEPCDVLRVLRARHRA
ncbi:MAG: bifunctional phosphoribosyl-AMP cyclohydrolase/phosphoribosyl-ATP diphosphatase HisIE [Candidatus Limnocylindrales bacterium]